MDSIFGSPDVVPSVVPVVPGVVVRVDERHVVRSVLVAIVDEILYALQPEKTLWSFPNVVNPYLDAGFRDLFRGLAAYILVGFFNWVFLCVETHQLVVYLAPRLLVFLVHLVFERNP